MNLGEMRASLRTKIGNPTEVDVPNSKLDELLNQATGDIRDRYRFHKARKRCTFNTVAGQSRYDLPSDVLSLLRVGDLTNYRKLVKWGDRQLSSRPDPTQSGHPLYYVRYRDWVELSPIPDDVYVIELFYKYAATAMTSDADVPGLPPTWHVGIVTYARYLYYEEQNDAPKMTVAYEGWKLWVSDKPTEVDEETVDIDSGVEIMPLSAPRSERLDFDHSD